MHRTEQTGRPHQNQYQQEDEEYQVLKPLEAGDQLRNDAQESRADDRADDQVATADEQHQKKRDDDVDIVEVRPTKLVNST